MSRSLKAIAAVGGPRFDPGAKNKRDCNVQFSHIGRVWLPNKILAVQSPGEVWKLYGSRGDWVHKGVTSTCVLHMHTIKHTLIMIV